MLPPIHLDHQPRRVTGEIEDVRPERHLPPKLGTAELLRSQGPPQVRFCIRHSAAQGTGMRDGGGHGATSRFVHGWTDLPRKGRRDAGCEVGLGLRVAPLSPLMLESGEADIEYLIISPSARPSAGRAPGFPSSDPIGRGCRLATRRRLRGSRCRLEAGTALPPAPARSAHRPRRS